jgi:hypothetical protein
VFEFCIFTTIVSLQSSNIIPVDFFIFAEAIASIASVASLRFRSDHLSRFASLQKRSPQSLRFASEAITSVASLRFRSDRLSF